MIEDCDYMIVIADPANTPTKNPKTSSPLLPYPEGPTH
jgi:hypothetical protein